MEDGVKDYKKKIRKLIMYLYYSCRLRGVALLHRKWVFSQLVFLILALILLLYASGTYQYFIATSFEKHYIHWGPNVTLEPLFEQIKNNQVPSIMPINVYNHPYIYLHKDKCVMTGSATTISIVYVVKSSIENFQRRNVIRKTWGQETRFHHAVLQTVFLLGIRPGTPHLQGLVDAEVTEHADIVQGEFLDTYFNNTIKTMMGLHWTYHNCPDVKYFLFADDDYFISTKNVLHFLQDPINYPQLKSFPIRLTVELVPSSIFVN
ncbi:unnamed protein product, partial [Meganyctiphanes norvegica]